MRWSGPIGKNPIQETRVRREKRELSFKRPERRSQIFSVRVELRADTFKNQRAAKEVTVSGKKGAREKAEVGGEKQNVVGIKGRIAFLSGSLYRDISYWPRPSPYSFLIP
jgi:hypothetical protein